MSIRLAFIIFLCGQALIGCAAREHVKPISNSYLEDRDVTVADDSLPFNHAWIDPNIPSGHYTKVFFRTVTIEKLPKGAWKASKSPYISSEKDYLKEAKLLSEHFLDRLNTKVKKYPKGTFVVTDKGESGGLVFDIAITELEFTHPIEKAGVMLVPVPGSSVAFSAVSEPHVAFAARVYDGESGKLLATVADRKFPPIRLIDVNKLTVTSSAREIVSIWADLIAEGLNRDRFAKVSSRGLFSILPW
jgi:hypothetical protein